MMDLRYRLILGMAFAVLFTAAACGGEDGSGERPRIVATTSIVGDWAQQVGGDAFVVDVLVPEGADAHTFSLTPDDVRKIDQAQGVFLSGAGLERAFEDAIRENAGGPVIELSEGLDLATFEGGGLDPHYWLDPSLASQAVARLGEELAALAPAEAEAIRERAAAYREELAALDSEIAAAIAGLPPSRKYLVTFHDAYSYFARRYGLTILGFVVESPDEEPSARALADLVEAMKANGVTIIYKEPQFSARVIEQLAADTGAEIRELPSGTLSDAYPTYIELMRTVAREITR